MIPKELIEKWKKEDEEFKEIRKKHANWKYIEKQKPKIKAALKYFIEKGDLYVASRIAGFTVDEMNELRKKADIPLVV